MVMGRITKFFRLKSNLELLGAFFILFILLLHTYLCLHIGLSFPESLYQTMILYVVHADLELSQRVRVDEKWVSIAFWVCRFAAPVLAISGLMDIFYGFLRPNRVPKRMKDHIVIAGMGRLGTRVYNALIQNKIKNDVLVIDKNINEKDRLLSKKLFFLNADLLEDGTYEASKMNHARSIWITTGDDANNLAIASDIIKKRTNNYSRIFIHLYEHSLLVNFQSFFFGLGKDEVVFFNIYDRVIDNIFSETGINGIDNLIVVGIGKFGRSILRRILKESSLAPSGICIIDRRAMDIIGKLTFDHEMDKNLEIHHTPLYNLQTINRIKEILHSTGRSLVIVCTDQDLLNLSFACHIIDQLNQQSEMIVKLSSMKDYIDDRLSGRIKFIDMSKETAEVLKSMVLDNL